MTRDFRIAVIATKYARENHADVIATRWLEDYPHDTTGWKPSTKISSLYVVEVGDDDISRDLCTRHDVRIAHSVADALEGDAGSLNVDAVLLIAEHGEYPHNQLRQKLYPRKELFDQVIAVFRRSGRVVPLFFDKHLSWNMAYAHEMYWTIRDMQIPFFAGSSLSLAPLVPPARFPKVTGQPLDIAFIYWNSLEAYLFHSIEIVEAIRHDSDIPPAAVTSITAWENDAAWQALDAGHLPLSLFLRAAEAVSPEARQKFADFVESRGHPCVIFQISFSDGTRVTYLMQHDVIRKWSLAWREEDTLAGSVVETAGRDQGFPHFARLTRMIEAFVLSGKSPVPLDRIYRSTMLTAACLHALAQGGIPYPTAWLTHPIPREWNGAA